MYKGVIDDQGRTNKRCTVTDTVPTLRSESHGNQPKALFWGKFSDCDVALLLRVPNCIDCKAWRYFNEDSLITTCV